MNKKDNKLALSILKTNNNKMKEVNHLQSLRIKEINSSYKICHLSLKHQICETSISWNPDLNVSKARKHQFRLNLYNRQVFWKLTKQLKHSISPYFKRQIRVMVWAIPYSLVSLRTNLVLWIKVWAPYNPCSRWIAL